MSIQRLPSGRLRVQVWDPKAERKCPPCRRSPSDDCERCGGSGVLTGANVSITNVLTPAELEELGAVNGTFAANQRKLAKRARERAREHLTKRRSSMTVWELWVWWNSTPIFFDKKKESTQEHQKERTLHFARAHRDMPAVLVDDEVVADWIAPGTRNSQVPVLRKMWNDAMSAKGGRKVTHNPWAGLGLEKSKGNALKQPPTEREMWTMIDTAKKLCPPSFAHWIELACFTGIRCGENDALRLDAVDWDAEEISVHEQWNVKAKKFTTPKYGPYTLGLVDEAADVLRRAMATRDCDSPFAFPTLRSHHYTPSTRTHHWNKVRARLDIFDMTLYLSTRHYFGWYALNILGLEPSVIAIQLGHKDGGRLVEQLYGHRDARLSRAKVVQAFRTVARVRPLPTADIEIAA